MGLSIHGVRTAPQACTIEGCDRLLDRKTPGAQANPNARDPVQESSFEGEPAIASRRTFSLDAVWAARKDALMGAGLAAIAAIATLATLLLALPHEQTFRHGLSFTFPEALQGRYPNNQLFSITDIVANETLQKVYEDQKLGDLGIEFRHLAAGVGISPYAPAHDMVVERYRSRLSNTRLSFGERTLIEKEFGREIDALSRRAAIISVSFSSRHKQVSPAVGQRVAAAVAAEWARNSIEQKGVLRLGGVTDGRPAIDMASLKKADLPSAVLSLIRGVEHVQGTANRVLGLDVAQTLLDQESGHSIASLLREVTNLDELELRPLSTEIIDGGIAQNAANEAATFLRHISFVAAQKAGLEKRLESVRQVLQPQFDRIQPRAPASPIATDPGPAGTVMQLNPDLLDKMVTMAVQSSEQERDHRNRLIDQQLRLTEAITDQERQLAMLQANTERLQAALKRRSPTAAAPTPDQFAEFRAKAVDLASRINLLHGIAKRFAAQASERRMTYAGKLYSSLDLPSSLRASSHHPLLNERSLIVVIAALVFGTVAGLAVGIARRRWSRPSDFLSS